MNKKDKTLNNAISYIGAIVAFLLFTPTLNAATNTYLDAGLKMPATDHGVQTSVATWSEVDLATPSVTLHFYENDDYSIFRREFGELDWGSAIVQSTGGSFSWVDTNVVLGEIYEYCVRGTGSFVFGYQFVSLRADRDFSRGIVILAIADNVIEGNEAKLDRLTKDLVGDGWKVKLLTTPSHYDAAWDFDTFGTDGYYSYNSANELRSQIQSIYNQNPNEVKMLYFLGHAPLALTGTSVQHSDLHGDRSGVATDFIYADIDGVYTDLLNSNPNASINNNTDSPRTLSSVPGDGIFDQNNMDSDLELGVGRVDPFNLPGATDAEHIANYLDKVHSYRHLKPYGMAGSEKVMEDKAGFRWHPSGQTGASATAMTMFSIFGPSQMENYVPYNILPNPIAPNTNADVQHLINTGPYMLYTQNDGKPPSTDFGSAAAHRMSAQSQWSDWWDQIDSRRDMFRDTNMTLTWLYTGVHTPEFYYSPLGIGEPYGEVVKKSANAEYWQHFLNQYSPQSSMTVREFIHTYMGDPTLRFFPVEPVSNVAAVADPQGVSLNWTAPVDMSRFEEYRVYRSDDLMGDFQLIASGLSSTNYTDMNPLAGSNIYMVKAVHLVEYGSGPFLNGSQGAFATIGLKIDTNILPPLPVGEPINVSLQTSGAAGIATWTLISGALPQGITLASDGTLQGATNYPGYYEFELEVTDGVSTVSRVFNAFVDSAETVIADVDLRQNTGNGLEDQSFYERQLTVHGNPQWDAEGGMIFDGVDDAIQLHTLANATFPHFNMFPSSKSSGDGFALVAAFKADPSSQGGTLLSKALNYDGFATNQNQYAIQMLANGKIKSLVSWGPITSAQSYNDGEWHTVAFVRVPGMGTELFIDGVSVGTNGNSGPRIVTEDFLIGARWNGSEAAGITDVFDGSIADVLVYKTGITAGEVLAIHERRDDIGAPANLPPVAVASATPLSGEAPLMVNLDASGSSDSDGNIVSYSWQQGGVEFATGVAPSHSFGVGSHLVELVVTDDDGATHTDSVSLNVVAANVAPVAVASATPLSGEAPLMVNLDASASSDSDGNIVSYSWQQGGVEFATGVAPSHSFGAGLHVVDLVVTDDGGATHTDNVTIDVNAVPIAVASATPNSGEAPLDVVLDASGSSDSDGSIVSYDWFLNASWVGTGVTANLNLAEGNHSIDLVVTDNEGAQSQTSVTVDVTSSSNPPGNVVTVPIEASDIQLNSNGSSGTVGKDVIRVGKGSTSPRSVMVLPFKLPALPSGHVIKNVTLNLNLEGWNNWNDALANTQVDLYGIDDVRLSTNVDFSLTYVDGTNPSANANAQLLQDGLLDRSMINHQSSGNQTIPVSSVDFSSFIQDLYDNGAQENDVVFLTLAHDTNLSSSRYFEVSSANSAGFPKPEVVIETELDALEVLPFDIPASVRDTRLDGNGGSAWYTQSKIRIGNGDNASTRGMMVIPFKLPQLNAGHQVTLAELHLNLQGWGGNWNNALANTHVDLYYIHEVNETSPVVDYNLCYVDGTNPSANAKAYLMQDDFIGPGLITSSPSVQNLTIPLVSVDLSSHIQALYDAGAVEDDYVFFSLAHDSVLNTQSYYRISSGDATSYPVPELKIETTGPPSQ